jgi:hypothetical protein
MLNYHSISWNIFWVCDNIKEAIKIALNKCFINSKAKANGTLFKANIK